jgi:tRNA(Ile)-lysidine synthase
MLQEHDRVLIGVSGGADSVALLLTLKTLHYNVAAAHLNHGLRGEESDKDERFVEELCDELGVPCFTQRVDIARQPGNLEAAGRLARKDFFNGLAEKHGFSKIALAHNREDRVETFMLHLMRGAGSSGLVSMAPVSGNLVRPFIETSRVQIEEFLTSAGRSWRTDATNSDVSFSRNRMRHEALPWLAALFNSRLPEALSRTISLLQDEDEWMTALARQWLAVNRDAKGVDVQALHEAPAALARRVIREALRENASKLADVTYEHIEAVRSLLEPGKSGKVVPLPMGTTAVREFDRLIFLPSLSGDPEFAYSLVVPGDVRVAELGLAIRASIASPEEVSGVVESVSKVYADGDRIGPCVTIRNWQPGDYYRPAGWPAGKLKKLFQRARVPRSQRHRWPVIASGSAIVWVASFPVSREFLPDSRSKKIVAFEALPD